MSSLQLYIQMCDYIMSRLTFLLYFPNSESHFIRFCEIKIVYKFTLVNF